MYKVHTPKQQHPQLCVVDIYIDDDVEGGDSGEIKLFITVLVYLVS